MRSIILAGLSASLCLAQTSSSVPTLVGAGFSNPFPLTVAPGQLLTLFVEPPAAYYTTEPMPTISAVFWNGSDEAMPVLQIKQTTTGCVVPSTSGACPSLLALTVQVPFDAPISPAAGSNIVVRPSGIAVFVSGQKSGYFGAQASPDQVHILTSCDALFLSSPLPPNSGSPLCAPMITHANGSQVSINSPAVAGEELVAYATGLGQTNPALTTGQPASTSSPAVATFNLDFNFRPNALATRPLPTAGVPLFAGSTQGYVGLYQMNFIVPPIPAGLQPCAYSGVMPDVVSGVYSNLTVSIGSQFSFDGAGICVQTLPVLDPPSTND
jgi:uncharacterized protein (TIGR03437 family)